ncbi:MAG: hypothetical protein JRN15_21395 [Nitrososphaerota archaeon]|nr:hypothetical protein [Nitrososphaerota archaeon]
MAKIRVPNVMKLGLGSERKSPEVEDGYLEYEVTEDVKKFSESLSERERETFCSTSSKEKRDLREVLAEHM